MPVALVVLLLDLTLIYHASRTGRLRPWAFIILLVPMMGAIAYIAVELVPEWFSSPGARQARQRVANRLDPEKRYRELSDRLAGTDTIANRAALADECANVGRFSEAEAHYDHILKLPMGHDPAYALRKAQAEFSARRPADALATLDDLQKQGRTSIPPTHIFSMPARSPRSDVSTRRWRNITRSPAISQAPRRGCATACCCRRSAAAPRHAWSSTNS
nr:hypothetical protein [Bradyrhizobium sp. MOS003]